MLDRLGPAKSWEQSLGWEESDVEGPATEKRETLLALAQMTNNAYYHKGQVGWYDLGGNWTAVSALPNNAHCHTEGIGIGT
jgi:putative lipase involved disintegration of autophagic bodies